MCDIVGCDQAETFFGPMDNKYCDDCKQKEIDEGAEESEFIECWDEH